MAPRRGGGGGGGSINIGGGSGGGSEGIPCSICDTSLAATYIVKYPRADLFGMLIVNAIWAGALLLVFFINRRPAAKLTQFAIFCFFNACVFQSVRWGLILGYVPIPHGYRYEASVIVLTQRLGWVKLLAALVRAMRPGKILGAGPWVGVFVLGALNLTYVVYDFILSDLAVKDWTAGSSWTAGDRDFSLLWTEKMVGAYAYQLDEVYPTTYNRDKALQRLWRVYLPQPYAQFKSRGIQVKIGVAADVIALLLVLVIGGLHMVTWRRQGKAEVPRRRGFLAIAVGGFLASSLFRVVISARWILHNWKIITNRQLWNNWLDYFPDTDQREDYVLMPDYWLPGYRTTVEAFPVLQVIFEQIGPVFACALVVLSMAAERQRFRAAKQQEAAAVKMQQVYSN
ncbi:hypothetical protein PWT90_02797 [Aphanocladium album]|nr:hypothetical protein PWT90_02797 [Aphanocladium album]